MINQTSQVFGRRTLRAAALMGLLLTFVLAQSELAAAKAGVVIAGDSTASRSAPPASQDTTIYSIKEAGIQFDVPKGWKTEVDKSTNNVVLRIEDGAMTITFVVEDKFAAVASGMKDGLKEQLTDMKSDGDPKEDTHNGMVHLEETGAGMLKDQPIFWSIDVLKANKNVTILTFGIKKIVEAHSDEYGKWVASIKKI
jgi:hypothetical protein